MEILHKEVCIGTTGHAEVVHVKRFAAKRYAS
jgi:peptide methionine sulfoxide reductase MsrA